MDETIDSEQITPGIQNKLFFSLISGELYKVQEDEVKNLDNFQIPLVKPPLSHCRKCYGRMHIGFNDTHQRFEICHRCGRACIDFKAIEESKKKKLDSTFATPNPEPQFSELPTGTTTYSNAQRQFSKEPITALSQ